MANKLFEKKTFTSFDKNYSAEIFIKKPDKYRDIENHSIAAENIITMGSALSYTAASFKKDNLINGEVVNQIRVDEDTSFHARVALQRMLLEI